MTLRELRDQLASLGGQALDLDVTVVDDSGQHFNITRALITADNEGERVVAIEYDE